MDDIQNLIPVPMIGFKALHQRIKAQEVQTKAHQGIQTESTLFCIFNFFDGHFLDLEPSSRVQDLYFLVT
jgi:hypothetical protein